MSRHEPESHSGDTPGRRLWRTDEIVGVENSVGKWRHLRQTWIVPQETKDREGNVEIGDRYLITSLLWNFLKPWHIVLTVQNHWGVETDSFNSMDVQWREEHCPWYTKETSVV